MIFIAGLPDGSTRRTTRELLRSPLLRLRAAALHGSCGTRVGDEVERLNQWLIRAGTCREGDDDAPARAVDAGFHYCYEDERVRRRRDYARRFAEPARRWALKEMRGWMGDGNGDGRDLVVEMPSLALTMDHWLRVAKEVGVEARCVLVRPERQVEAVKALQGLQSKDLASAPELARIAQVWTNRAERACKSLATSTFVVSPDKIRYFHTDRLSPKDGKPNGRNSVENLEKMDMKLRSILESKVIIDSKVSSNRQRQNNSSITGGLDSVLAALLPGNKWDEASTSWPELKRESHSAYATIVTAGNVNYIYGAVTLGWSLALQDASRDRVALVTPEVGPAGVSLLEENGWLCIHIQAVPEMWFGTRKCRWRPTNRNNQRVRWGRMASKLRLWELVQYKQVFYLDPDAMVTGQAWKLLEREELLADTFDVLGEGGTGHKYVNAGVLLLKPSLKDASGMSSHFMQYSPPGLFPNIVDCTEQALINAFFMSKYRQAPAQLSYQTFSVGDRLLLQQTNIAVMSTQNTCTLCVARPDVFRDYERHAPLAIHFLRQDICIKPWKLVSGIFESMLPGSLSMASRKSNTNMDRLYKLRMVSAKLRETHLENMARRINRAACDIAPYRIWIELFHLSFLPAFQPPPVKQVNNPASLN